jgi:CO dehydrogenase/acetyl-CoA synthase gamma subunit (corrinoid Fe-S protein)
MALDTMTIFKYLPAAKRLESANCKKCGCTTCMMFAMKLSKGLVEIEKCPVVPEELIGKIKTAKKIQQKEVVLDSVKIGGETLMYRHQKTFIAPSAFFIALDCSDKEKIKRILDFEIESVGVKYKVDGVLLENFNNAVATLFRERGFAVITKDDIKNLQEVKVDKISKMVENLTYIRKKAVIDRDSNFSEPVFVRLEEKSPELLCAKASACICKYASLIIFDTFNEAVLTSLTTLRQNIFTDPEKPLQVESKVYEFNNPDENAYVFLTTNFALSYFAVANELSALKCGSYLVITPSEGMSVLTAWSAEKITAEIASKIVAANEILDKVKTKRLIIPGLLSDLKEDLQKALPNWEVFVGTVEAYKIPEFIKNLK